MILNLLILCCVTGRSSGFPISEDKVTSYLYGSVMLPCRFSFAEALTGLSVIWDMEKNYRKLILYKILNGEEKAEEQDPPYRGRVEISTEFPQGNLHLILRNVTYEDEGTYYCRAANAKGHGDRKVTLSIDALNADEPTVTLVTIGEKRRMKCRSSGFYHVPRVQWITARGEDLSGYGRHNITKQSNGRRLVESVLDYDVERNKQILCHIHEGRLRRSTRAVISDGTHPVSVHKF